MVAWGTEEDRLKVKVASLGRVPCPADSNMELSLKLTETRGTSIMVAVVVLTVGCTEASLLVTEVISTVTCSLPSARLSPTAVPVKAAVFCPVGMVMESTPVAGL